MAPGWLHAHGPKQPRRFVRVVHGTAAQSRLHQQVHVSRAS